MERNLLEHVYINLLIYIVSRKEEEKKRKGKEFIGTGLYHNHVDNLRVLRLANAKCGDGGSPLLEGDARDVRLHQEAGPAVLQLVVETVRVLLASCCSRLNKKPSLELTLEILPVHLQSQVKGSVFVLSQDIVR